MCMFLTVLEVLAWTAPWSLIPPECILGIDASNHSHKLQEKNLILEFPFSMLLKISMTTSPYLRINVRDSKF